MICPICGKENVSITVVNEIHQEKGKHGFLWWLFIGWWWWIFFTLLAIIVKIFKPKNTKNKIRKIAVCQDCGNSWDIPTNL